MNDVIHLPRRLPARARQETIDHRSEGAARDRREKPRRRAGFLFGTGAALILAGALLVGGWHQFSQARAVMDAADQRRDFVPSYRVATVQAGSPDMVISLPATTLAFISANIYARASGYIVERKVDIGDHVKLGELLAQITAPELDRQIAQNQSTLAQTNAAVQQAEASRDLAHVTWQRNSTLVKQGWVTQQQGDTDRLNLQAQEAAVKAAKDLAAAQQHLVSVLHQQRTYQSVVAPFDGIVTQRNINIGDLVQADAVNGTFMFNIMQTDVIRVQVYVPQDHAFGVKAGIAAVVRVPELPDRPFAGKVTRVADALQPGTRTLLTEIDIPNPDGALTPGVYCLVELHIPRNIPALLVPAEAIISNRDGLQVAVIEDGSVRFRKISVARDLGTQLEVRDGVKPGEQVILNPSVDLADGSKVRPRPESQLAGK